MQIYSFSPFGYEGSLVTVEVDIRRGIPAIDLVGLADSAVKESRERMRSAIRNSGFTFPPERVLISLSPADLRKEGAGFDLALALGVLSANGEDDEEKSGLVDFPVLVMGELELSGKLRPVRGIHAAASTAQASGITRCIVPKENGNEAREVSGMKVFAASTLQEAYQALFNEEAFTQRSFHGDDSEPQAGTVEIGGVLFPEVSTAYGFESVRGQGFLVRALQIAAAGGHNVLAYGPPGCGKTLVMQRFGSLVPLLTMEEAQSVTRIHSIAGLVEPSSPLVRVPPFRMPHQTASIEGMCGGGPSCRPGEISLSHNGALFLDEAGEFKTSVLQMLRVPLESRSITISRAGRSTVYPASFQLLMASNPCPCGNYGSDSRICLCSAHAVDMYWKKFSGPLLDRIDLRVKVSPPSADENEKWSTQALREKIARAVRIQRERQGFKNARMTPEQIVRFCNALPEASAELNLAVEKYDFSPRGVSSCLKLARTIADMEDSDRILVPHMKEAILYRRNEGGIVDL